MKNNLVFRRLSWMIVALTTCICLSAGQPLMAESFKTIGTFRPAPAISLYLVKDQAGPINLRVGLSRGPNRQLGDHVTVRIFSPDEDLIYRRHFNLAQPKEEFILGSMEIDGLNHDMAFGADPKERDRPWAQMQIDLNEPGIYQVRVTAGSHNTYVRLDAPEPLAYGVSFQNGQFNHWPQQPETLWAFVPPKATELTVQGRGVSIADEQGQSLLELPQNDTRQMLEISVDKAEVLWQLQMNRHGAFRAWGFPLILCNTPQAARAIRASVIELPDGTVVAHRFQKDIYQRLRSDWLSPQRIGTIDDVVPQFTEDHRQAMEEDAITASLLVNNRHNLFNYARFLLEQQNTDPDSHFAGSLIGWQEVAKRSGLEGRWDTYQINPPLHTGISDRRSSWARTIAWLCVAVDRPWNPYYGNQQVIHRLAAGALADLLRIGEDERFPDYQRNDYPGSPGFSLPAIAGIYGLLAPHLDPDTRALWTHSIRRLLDRSYSDTIVSARNQSAHYLDVYYNLALGSGDPADAELAHGYASRFVDSQHAAGYYSEAIGPDASYNGITHWYMGQYARRTGDSDMLASLGRSYRFFNHTVAPEPNGAIRGGFNFSHRTASGFYAEQYGGARRQMAHLVPEVAVWRTAAGNPTERLQEAVSHVRQGLGKPDDELANVIYMMFIQSHYHDVENIPLEAIWPALESAPFIRNFANELIAVRQPGYFASIYVGKPAGRWYIRMKESLRSPYPDEQESTAGRVNGLNHRPQTPLLGGGLSLLHSPGYGSAVLATNWSPLTYHGPVLIHEDGTRAWADYHTTRFQLDESAATLAIQGSLDGAAIDFERFYTFAPDALHQQVRFTTKQAVNAESFFENIPLALGSIKPFSVTLTTADGAQPIPGQVFDAQELHLRDSRGHGFNLRFSAPQRLIYQPNGLTEVRADGNLTVGRIQVLLPVPTHEQPTTLQYELEPVSP